MECSNESDLARAALRSRAATLSRWKLKYSHFPGVAPERLDSNQGNDSAGLGALHSPVGMVAESQVAAERSLPLLFDRWQDSQDLLYGGARAPYWVVDWLALEIKCVRCDTFGGFAFGKGVVQCD